MPPEQTPTLASSPQSKPVDGLRRIRTYQSDVEEMMRKQQVSKATIAIAEDKKRVEKKAEPTAPASVLEKPSKVFQISNRLPLGERWNGKLIAMVVASLLLVGGSAVGAFFYFRGSAKPIVKAPAATVPQSNTVTLEGNEGRAGAITAIQKTIQALSVPQNEIRTIPLNRSGTALTTPDLFAVLEADAPQTLVRALGTSPVLGVHGFKGGQSFILFSVSSYDYAFSGMLVWEKTLLTDIGPLFGVSSRDILGKVGSTTTEALSNTIAIKDVIIKNKDARAAFAPDGSIVFLYSFIDKQTLVFTTNEETLKTLIGKAGSGRLR